MPLSLWEHPMPGHTESRFSLISLVHWKAVYQDGNVPRISRHHLNQKSINLSGPKGLALIFKKKNLLQVCLPKTGKSLKVAKSGLLWAMAMKMPENSRILIKFGFSAMQKKSFSMRRNISMALIKYSLSRSDSIFGAKFEKTIGKKSQLGKKFKFLMRLQQM